MSTRAEVTLRQALDRARGVFFTAEWLLGEGVLAPDETVLRVVGGDNILNAVERSFVLTDRQVLYTKAGVIRGGYAIRARVALSEVKSAKKRGFFPDWLVLSRRGRLNLRIWYVNDGDAQEFVGAITTLLSTGRVPPPPASEADKRLSGATTRAEQTFLLAAQRLGTHMKGEFLNELPGRVLAPEETVLRIVVGAGDPDFRPLGILTDRRFIVASRFPLNWGVRAEVPIAGVRSAGLTVWHGESRISIDRSDGGKPVVMPYGHEESAAEAMHAVTEFARTGQLPPPPPQWSW